jgi:hypothetical protein
MIIYQDGLEWSSVNFSDFIADGYECKELEHFKPKIHWWIVIYVYFSM